MTKLELFIKLSKGINDLSLWSVYALLNQNTKEIHIGVAVDPAIRCFDHYSGKCKETRDWDFQKHAIRMINIESDLSHEKASESALLMQESREFDEYRIIQPVWG